MIKGKCQEDFTKWYEKRYDETYHIYHTNWEEFPFSFQMGVYIEFFDSVGIDIAIMPYHIAEVRLYKAQINNCVYDDLEYIPKRWQLNKLILQKASEIYNNKE